MSSSQKAKIALTLALLLLFLSGTAAGYAILRLHQAEILVRHTYDVEVSIGDLESALTEVGRTRVAYVNAGTPELLQKFWDGVNKVAPALAKVRQLTSDNQMEQQLCDRLEGVANERVASSRASVELKQQNVTDPQRQLQFTFLVAQKAFDTAVITQQMKQIEENLLQQRNNLSESLFTALPGILLVSFALSALMFWFHYQLLGRELRERTEAESQLRQLSLQLMRVQDEEHRRFARELHDGLGQTLATAKMMVEFFHSENSGDPQTAELAALLGDALSQTRTISHLFHPPLLDEIGFPSAANWLIEGYAKRMGVDVSANIPGTDERLPRNVEITLYRVLQEALNNIQRHAESSKIDVDVQTGTEFVTLRVKDFGQGIPTETLAAFNSNGRQSGVGLTGMKERVKEQGGKLEIHSETTGTEIIVKIPIHAHVPGSTSLD